MSTNAEQESKRIWPCVRCAESTFRKKIAPKLKKYGYKIWAIGGDWRIWSCVCTNFENEGKWVSNEKPSDIKGDRYLCRTIPEFLAAVKALAIERGWFKEEMKWKEMCNISELPTRLRRLAEYRKRHGSIISGENDIQSFYWEDTPEGFDFWFNVDKGVVPANLEKVLDKFEKEHPELLDEPKQEAISKKETATEQAEEKQPEPSTPTLAEARKQFRELTKHYTVEQLSAPELPRSWEEYLEQNPIADATELDKKLEALRKLRLMRDKWVEGCEGGNIVATITQTHCALSFPTQKMANDFLNTFRDLIEEAGDLI